MPPPTRLTAEGLVASFCPDAPAFVSSFRDTPGTTVVFGSGEVDRNIEANIPLLTDRDVLKFVICDRDDYDWSVGWLAAHPDLPCEVFFSPSSEQLSATDLADWILEDNLDVRLQLQLHKLLWGDAPGH